MWFASGVSGTKVAIGGNATLQYYKRHSKEKRVIPNITASLANNIIFEDLDYDSNQNIIAEGTSKYQLTATDVAKMQYQVYLGNNKYDKDYEIYLENNQAKVRKK